MTLLRRAHKSTGTFWRINEGNITGLLGGSDSRGEEPDQISEDLVRTPVSSRDLLLRPLGSGSLQVELGPPEL